MQIKSYLTLSLFLEYYLSGIVDLLVLFFLIIRNLKLNFAGHQLHRSFPLQIRIKFLFIGLWGMITFAESGLLLASYFTPDVWIKYH